MMLPESEYCLLAGTRWGNSHISTYVWCVCLYACVHSRLLDNEVRRGVFSYLQKKVNVLSGSLECFHVRIKTILIQFN